MAKMQGTIKSYVKHLGKPFLTALFVLLSEQSYAQVCEQQQPFIQFLDIPGIMNALGSKPISLNSNRIRPWNAHARLPCQPPFKVTYKTGKKEFSFVAVEHVEGPTSLENSHLKAISTLIEEVKPQGIVLEVVTNGVMQPEMFEGISTKCYRDGKLVCGEAAHAAVVAEKSGAEVQGGEPVPAAINEVLLKIEPKDSLLAYRSAQAVISFKRQGVPRTEWEQKFAQELHRNGISENDIWSITQFADWTIKNLNSLPEQVAENWFQPRNDDSATVLQRISFKVDVIREPLILRMVEQVINKHDKTMILYGADHFYKQSPVYEEAFGTPQIECLSQD